MEGKFYYAEIIAPGAAPGRLRQRRRSRCLPGAGRFALERRIPDPECPNPEVRAAGSFATTWPSTPTARARCVSPTSPKRAGSSSRGYGMGVATGDFNNDGCVDLYLTSLGPNQLFRNNCNGTFTDVSKQSRTDDPSWSVSSAFLDYDRDGWLDLFVGNYLSWRVESNTPCFTPSGRPDYCSPNVYQPQPSRLFRNNHDGTFTDVTDGVRDRARVRAGARRIDGRLQRRRMDRRLRGERRSAQPTLDQPAQRHVQKHRTAVRHGAECAWESQGRHGR